MTAFARGLKCDSCGRFMSAPTEPAQVIPVRDSVHPYTADYRYLCAGCAENNERWRERRMKELAEGNET